MKSVRKFRNNVLQKKREGTITEEATDKKLIKCSKTAKLTILIVFLYTIKCKWKKVK